MDAAMSRPNWYTHVQCGAKTLLQVYQRTKCLSEKHTMHNPSSTIQIHFSSPVVCVNQHFRGFMRLTSPFAFSPVLSKNNYHIQTNICLMPHQTPRDSASQKAWPEVCNSAQLTFWSKACDQRLGEAGVWFTNMILLYQKSLAGQCSTLVTVSLCGFKWAVCNSCHCLHIPFHLFFAGELGDISWCISHHYGVNGSVPRNVFKTIYSMYSLR